jgi:acetolactate synthase-1/2/3 large subunit
MNLGTINSKNYDEIELEAVINEVKPKKEGISMGETIENKHSKGDAIMVSDVGQHQMFLQVCQIQFF